MLKIINKSYKNIDQYTKDTLEVLNSSFDNNKKLQDIKNLVNKSKYTILTNEIYYYDMIKINKFMDDINNIFKQMNNDIVLNDMIIKFNINEDTKIKNLDNLIIQCNEKFATDTMYTLNINNDLDVGLINISVMSFHGN
jgi:hypothetical protein